MADRFSPSYSCNREQASAKGGVERKCLENNNNDFDSIVGEPCWYNSHQEKLYGGDVAQAASEEDEENGEPGMDVADEEVADVEVADEEDSEEEVADEEVSEEDVAEEDVAEEVGDEEVVEEDAAQEEVADEYSADEEVADEAIDEEVAEEEVADEEVAEEEVAEEEVAEEEVADEEVAEEEVADEEVAEEETAEEKVEEEKGAEEDNAVVDEEQKDETSLAAFRQQMMFAHNAFRAHHDAPKLVECNELDSRAQAWAYKLAEKDGNLVHEGTADEGENLSVNLWRSKTYRGWVPVNLWYKEAANYKFQGQPAVKSTMAVTSRFTQVVWRGSKKAGFGRAVSSTGRVFAVAKYTPPGNFEGEYDANVLLPKNGKLMSPYNQE